MKHKYEVTDSSTIKSLEYDFDNKILVVEFKAGSEYLYKDVPENVAREFFLAESKGKHFAAHIKGAYDTEKMSVTSNPPKAYKALIAKPAAVKAHPAPKAQPEQPKNKIFGWPFSFGNRL